MLGYGYIKNYYRLVAIDLSRQKELLAYSKAKKWIEFVGQFRDDVAVNDTDEELTTVLATLEKSGKQN